MPSRKRRAELYLRRPSGWRYIAVGVAISALLAGILMWIHRESDRSTQLRDQLIGSYERRISQIALLSQLKDVETTQRGYLLTRDPALLRDYEAPYRAVEAQLASFALADTPFVPADYPKQVVALAQAKLREMDQSIAVARSGRFDDAEQIVRSGRGRQLMARLRQTIGTMIARETALSTQRLEAFVEQRDQQQRHMTFAYLGLVIALTGLLIALWRTQRARFAALVNAFEAGERNEAILESTTDSLLILDALGRIDRVNAATDVILGYGARELHGVDFLTIVDLGAGEEDFRQRIGMVDGPLLRSFFVDCAAYHRDGHRVAVDVAIGAMMLASGVHFVVSLRDISERKRIERVKDELIANVSHELRTPLTSVIGALALLRAGSGGDVPTAAARLIEIAESNSRRLIRLINDMLDLDRIASGALRLTRKPIDLRRVVEQACDDSGALAGEKAVTINNVMPNTPVTVDGDGDRLLQVVANLLSNAIRFAPHESAVDVTLTVDPSGLAFVSVEDRGPGIPAGFRDRIFGRFEQAARAGGATGTGLGLAISREIVARHDGKIWFEDRRGGGTRFTFALECMPQEFPEEDVHHILIAGQEEAFVRCLPIGDYRYEFVTTAAEALRALERTRFAAVLVNEELSPQGGFAFAHAARRRDPPVVVPILIVVPASAPHGEPAAIDVVDWIDKPVDPDHMEEALNTAFRRTAAPEPVILHLDGGRNLLDVVTAGLAPDARIVTATDLPSARALLEQATPDVAIFDLKHHPQSRRALLPFLVDAAGLAIPTIIYASHDTRSVPDRIAPFSMTTRGSTPDIAATLARAIATASGRGQNG